ncbi:hypothetical protein ACFL6S_20765 [Candidatus Poribacteria bacterium]
MGDAKNTKIGDSFSQPVVEYSWPRVRSCRIMIEIPLDFYRLKRIEERRQDNIRFKLSGRALVAEHPSSVPNEQQERRRDVEGFTTAQFEIYFDIPQSRWIGEILPALGYGRFELIEVPIPEEIVPETFHKALQELRKSQRYFIQGDYDKAVAHCRNVVDLIPRTYLPDNKRPFGPKIQEFLGQYLPSISGSKQEFIKVLLNSVWGICSDAVHPQPDSISPSNYFDRADAEAIRLVTTALIAYVGKLLKQRESGQ